MSIVAGDAVDFIERLYPLDVGDDCPVHIVAAVIRADARGIKRVVSGRGFNARDAANRCIFEAIERQSAVYNESFAIIRSTAAELGHEAVDPRLLMQISDAQYSGKSEWNRQVEEIHRLPSKFDENQPVAWIRAQSLSADAAKFIPAAHCLLGYPEAHDEGFPVPDSSGLAAGTSVADAAARGLLELVERDAVAIWWYNCLPMPALVFNSEKLKIWTDFSDWVTRCNRRFWLLDLKTDIPVPVAAAISCNQYGSDLSFGFAAAATPEKAAEHAMCEMVQFDVTKKYHKQQSSGSPFNFLSWCISSNVKDYPFIAPEGEIRNAEVTPLTPHTNILGALQQKGLQAYFVDFSKAEQNTKVVRVIVPGLRQIWPRFAEGRLYDIPYRLGMLATAKTEAELNPIPILY